MLVLFINNNKKWEILFRIAFAHISLLFVFYFSLFLCAHEVDHPFAAHMESAISNLKN